MAKKKKCYVVYVGAEVGVFNDWETVKPLVDRYPDATHKGFNSLEEAKTSFENDTAKIKAAIIAKNKKRRYSSGSRGGSETRMFK
ncbi:MULTISPECIES: RNase H1/viroplasmin domain-containing protein [unclassified Photobacterium]|uniref:RNase H1/viroplasmin domain-containing protein n=1 Tax=unclassified Photobacterium TaxID=2628852 RepID=UPI001EDD1726|nr:MULTISPECIES: RNase H1/viroplasmin domain-containing protein [unclassified Photobacterium]MCG3864478.1 RNase H1/viroplasmin domain-containing protein [Photobacterium sp. Ph6]MCG3877441.1 RNase H1/viroplasmin domain-containing protein [Photobacterium sp. Ph5]